MKPTTALPLILSAFSLIVAAPVSGEDLSQQILQASGVKGGLIVHVGCGDGRMTASLLAGDSFLVHGLDADANNVEKARQHIRSKGLYGRVSVDTFNGRQLPYVDNLVNLLVVSATANRISADEIARVLAPQGVALVKGDLRNTDTRDLKPETLAQPAGWTKLAKPWPDAIDDWTHYLHGPDNNAVAEDRVAGPPRHMQWLAGPKWTRHHHDDKGTYPTIRAVVSSGGRLYYMVDETKSSIRNMPSNWFLAARDGFSGVLLWKKPLQAETFQRRLEQVWRTLIADGDHVYVALGTDQPLSALDGASGAVIRNYEGTEGVQEMIKDPDTLFVVSPEKGILALRADTGALQWQWSPRDEGAIVPLTLAASEGRVFVKTDTGVSCLSAEDGQTLWQTALARSEKPIRLRWPREKLLVKDGVVLCSFGGKDPTDLNRDKFEYLGSHPRVHDYGGKLAALSATDGSLLWQTEYLPGLESMPGEIYIWDSTVWLGPAFAEPRDLHTGKVKTSRPVLDRLWTSGHHYRCYPGKATCRYILTAKRGIEMIDLAGENHSRNNWVRATCRVGVTPCNGLLYAPPHSCGCYMEAKLYGFWALAAQRSTKEEGRRTKEEVQRAKDKGQSETDDGRLEKGPAYRELGIRNLELGTAKTQNASPGIPHSALRIPHSEWPTYRHDAARSGSSTVSMPAELKHSWKADLGGKLSAVTMAGGKVFVAQVDAHTVHALDADSGKALWQFTAGGRVDSPPTIYRGLVLFGSRDGWVYCLRASDGQLVWRFRAAPHKINAVAYEQVESLWPAHGSVLINNGIAYVAAGRSSYLDDGIVLFGLDPATGVVRCTTRVKSEHTGALDPPPDDKRIEMDAKISQNNTDYKTFLAADQSDAFSMRGALPDILVADGGSIFMRHLRFDGELVRQEQKRPHLFSTSSLLDDTEHHRCYWVFGTGDFSRTPVAYPWIVTKSLAVPYGLMLAFDDKTVWSVHRVGGKGQRQKYVLRTKPRPDPAAKDSLLADFATRSGKQNTAGESWTIDLPLRPRAMIRAGDTLVIGGMNNTSNAEKASAPSSGPDAENSDGVLLIASCSDGSYLGKLQLDTPPVWDGIAAARGKLYVATTNGSLVCLANK